MRSSAVLALLLLLLVQLCACAGKQPLPPPSPDKEPAAAREGNEPPPFPVDPAGPIRAPSLPPGMAASPAGPGSGPGSGLDSGLDSGNEAGGAAPYTVETAVRFAGRKEHPEQAEIIRSTFEKAGMLHGMRDKIPGSRTGLEQRLRVSLEEGRTILHSQGYYAGTVEGRLEENAPGAQERFVVRVLFLPGPRYTVGRTQVRESPSASSPKTDGLPRDLAGVGLLEGAPAVAADLLAAVGRVVEVYQDNGYPFAAVAGTRYVADHAKRRIDAEILIAPGDFIRMGEVEQRGMPSLRASYADAMRTWKPGTPWSRSRVTDFQDALRQSGLFQSIEVTPGKSAEAKGLHPVVTTLQGAPERSIGGALKYNSDFGPGVEGYWEHRNVSGRGDRFRLDAPLWQDMQEVAASYRLPFFLRGDQSFIANAGLLHQDLDAYELQSAAAAAGLERRLSRRWSAKVQASAEGGSIKDPDKPERAYLMFGLPLGAAYDSTNSPLDATQGSRLQISLAPYTGRYDGNFAVLRSRLDGQHFFALAEADRLLLALRGALGVVSGASAQRVPPSVRFYGGGGSSVRGYAYQSLGPRDDDNNPLGGSALVESSAELRWKITPEWGLVAFLDGGTVLDQPLRDQSLDPRFGTGLGLRYYTAIGPVRLDLATPLNPRDDDEVVQVYISIGQAF